MATTLRLAGETTHALPWAKPFRRRCKARLARGEDHGYFGRCELDPGHDGPHALERGMEVVLFRDTDAPS